MASSGGDPTRNPIKYWRWWVVYVGCMAAMVKGSLPVADATGDFAFAQVYIAVVAVFMWIGLRWANRRNG